MSRALRALLGASIDYAGLFPPAKLSLEPAVANYVKYAQEADGWMLGKFVCPVAKLGELAALVPEPRVGMPWGISALGRGGESLSAWLDGLTQDLAIIDRVPSKIRIGAFEVRLPLEAFTQTNGVRSCLDAFRKPGVGLFVEIPPGEDFLDRARVVFAALTGRRGVGLKLRCGGLEATAFPAPTTVAAVLALAGRHGVALKATAGLHHPFPHHDETLGVSMYGFINLFVAALLAARDNLPPETLTELLDRANVTDFRLTEGTLGWRERELTCTEIQHGRRDVILSFGSCSFDEPRDDLRQAGWLPTTGGPC